MVVAGERGGAGGGRGGGRRGGTFTTALDPVNTDQFETACLFDLKSPFLSSCNNRQPSKDSVQFSSVPRPLRSSSDVRDYSTEIFLQSFLRAIIVSSSGMRRDVHSLMLSIQNFLCRP